MKTLRNLAAALLLFFIMPIHGHAQTRDDQADQAERSHRTAVVKHGVHKVRNGLRQGYHKVVSTALSPVDNTIARHRADESTESH